MRSTGRAGAALAVSLATALTLGMASAAAQAAPSASGSGASWTSASAASRSGGKVVSTVTLITGDKVSLDAKGRVVRVVQGEGRQDVPVSVKKIHGHTYVIPADAARLLAKGKLDRRLFDVTELLKSKYDDESRDSLPLIVSYTSGRQAKADARAALDRADVTERRTLPVLNGAALTAPKSPTAEVWNALTDESSAHARTSAEGIAKVWLDGVRQASLDKSVPQIGAPTAWEAGYTGKGVTVAVLDTGVDQTHPDLAGAQVAEKNFSEAKDAVDRVGHGTHVASIITGSGEKSGGAYKGVAPDAKILDGKVLDDDGFGDDSGILAGMDWAVAQGAKVVNLSLGGGDTPEDDPLELAVNKYTRDKGVLFAIAAGNDGPQASTIGSPGSAAEALTVGAVDRNDLIAEFSSVGPTADGSLKPDITAPGVDIVAAKAAKASIGDPAPDGYISLSGTSMATPHVAGAAAILAQEHPDWTGRQIKQALTSSAKPGAGLSPYQQGTGRADLTKAITQSVVSEQTALDFGTQRWPHDDDVAVTKKVTYRNLGTEDVTLDLAVEATGPDGKPAPAGLFTASARQVTVPAGGTAEASVTADTKAGTADGAYSGALVATAGDQSVRTAVAVNREVESYDLTMKALNAKGKAGEAEFFVVGLDNDTFLFPEDTNTDGVVKARLPKGTYAAEVVVYTGSDQALLVQPRLALGKNTTVTYDARKAKKVSISTPDSKAKAGSTFLTWSASLGSEPPFSSGWGYDGFKGVSTAHVGSAVTDGGFEAMVGGDWSKAKTAYSLAYPRTKTFFTGYSHKPVASEYAKVKVAMGEPAKNKLGAAYTTWEKGSLGWSGGGAGTELPGTVTHYVTASSGLKWGFLASQYDSKGENEEAFQESAPVAYKAKKTYGTTFNVGVFGPSVGTSADGAGVFRYEDELGVCIPLFSDGKGHLGDSVTSKAKTVITADGKTIINEPTAPCGVVGGVPDAKTTYKVSTDVSRSSAVSGTTTRVTADWTFASARPAAGKEVSLPLSTVRFSPKLSVTGTAPAGKKLTVPVTVVGSAAGKNLKSLEVWASYDGGTTWKKASVKTAADGAKSVTLSNPKSATTVSLKAKVSDKSGNVANQAIYKAYKLVK